jgi:hypothetical protein
VSKRASSSIVVSHNFGPLLAPRFVERIEILLSWRSVSPFNAYPIIFNALDKDPYMKEVKEAMEVP